MARTSSLSDEYRPRERLQKYGASTLSLTELLSILCGTGGRGKEVTILANEILKLRIRQEDLVNLSFHELITLKGIGSAKATQILAGIELGKRLVLHERNVYRKIQKAEDVYTLVYGELSHQTQEHVLVIFLDSSYGLITSEIIFTGTMTYAVLHPREIFQKALLYKAYGIILVHNHPSGECSPSTFDISITKRCVTISKLLDIVLLDHVIVSKHGYYSFQESQHPQNNLSSYIKSKLDEF